MNLLPKEMTNKVFSKIKRGRPPFGQDEAMKIIAMLYPDIRSKRGKQNMVYQIMALGAIDEMGRPEIKRFFANPDTGKIKCSMLSEIGRLSDDGLMQEVARQVYDTAMKDGDLSVKDWVKVIRASRLQWLMNR